jgi:ABC-2 type transport system ATP-binding protein
MTVSPVIVAEDLHKEYGARVALRGLDLEVNAGEVFALVGPNGAGKTTTVEILEGYRRPTGGYARVLGFDPADHARELRQRIGVVLQECGFPTHLRVHEVVDAWRSYYDEPLAREELLELVELSDSADMFVRRLSGGQRRRLDFALALAGNPGVIFLDEPTTGFDPEARRRCWQAIENLRSLGKTILLTTHYLDEAERLADRVAVITAGRVHSVGTPRALARRAKVPTRIGFAAPDDGIAAHGRLLKRLAAEVERGRVEVQTADPGVTLQALLAAFGELRDLAVKPPTFEDAYLHLLRDDFAGAR